MENRGIRLRTIDEKSTVKKKTNHLLIIGIDEYTNGLNSLNNAVKDAKDFRDLMLKQYQFEEAHLTCLFNQEATRINVIETISRLLNQLTENDNLIFYYSGHGEQLKIGERERGYWIPTDAIPKVSATYIPNEEIASLFGDCKAHHIFGIVDSCFSGALFNAKRGDAVTKQMYSYPSRWLLTAGRLEVVSDGPPGQNSPFAKTLLTYLKQTKADDLWVMDLCAMVLKGMNYNTNQQTPRGEPLQGAGHYGGQFIFYKKGVEPKVVPSTNTVTENAGEKRAIVLEEEQMDTSPTPVQITSIPPPTKSTPKMPTNLAELEQALTTLIEEAELKAALTLLKKHLHKDASIGNDVTLLMSRFNSMNKEVKRGLVSSENARMSFARINYALTSYIEELDAADIHFPTTGTSNGENGDKPTGISSLEREGLETQRDLLQKRINRINKALVLETDPSREMAYEEQVKELTEKLRVVKEQLV